jgi:hypothetical protein
MTFLYGNWFKFMGLGLAFFVMSSCQTAAPVLSTEEVSWITGKPTGTREHYLLTPTGKQIFQASLDWYYTQPEHRAMPANCAINVSDVLQNVRSDFKRFGNQLIPAMETQIARSTAQLNGKTYRSSIFNAPRSEASFVATINKNFKGGKIPTGTMVFGCLRSDCSGQAGDGHIGIVGDLDEAGNLQLYHNNWYRPENNGGVWAKFMVSKDHLSRGIKRQWMPTPWLKLTYSGDKLVGAKSVLPAIDDLDPFNYFTTFMVIPEIVGELDQGLTADPAVSERMDLSVKKAGMTCEVVSADGVMNVRGTPNGNLLGQVRNGTKFVWLSNEGPWSRVQVRIGGKLFGAGGDGSEKAYIHTSGVFCR